MAVKNFSISPFASTNFATGLATLATVQRFFDESLLLRLVDSGALSRTAARDICIQTATFAHELADESRRVAVADMLAVCFEQISLSFKE